jgi:type IV pilus assembly protein PilF
MRKPRGWMLVPIGLGVAACTSDSPPKDPNERSASSLYVLKGIQYMEGGRLDIARQDLQRAIDLDGRNVEARNAMGVLYERLEQPAEAEEQFKQALSLDENNADVAINYGRALCAQGKYEPAMKYFRAVLDDKIYSTPWIALTNAGICVKKQGQAQEAESYLRKALESNPAFAPALLEMAKLSLENGNALSARAFFQRYEAVGAPTAESLWYGVQTEQALGNGKDAGVYLKRLRRLFPESKEAQRTRQGHAAAP